MSEISLEEFVRETLLSIARGVRAAKDTSKQEDIVPIALHRINDEDTKSGDQIVKFSVGVEANKKTSAGIDGQVGGTLVSLITGNVAADGSVENNTTAIHRIEFGVPMNFSARWTSKNDEKG